MHTMFSQLSRTLPECKTSTLCLLAWKKQQLCIMMVYEVIVFLQENHSICYLHMDLRNREHCYDHLKSK